MLIWSKVHHVTNGILGKDWFMSAGHYLIEPTGRLFTRTRPIDSVLQALQVWLARAKSASAQLQLRAFLNNC